MFAHLPVRVEQLGFHSTVFFSEISYSDIFRKSAERFQVRLQYDWNNGNLHEDLCTFMTISRSVLFRMRNASEKYSRENQNTHFMFKFPLPPSKIGEPVRS